MTPSANTICTKRFPDLFGKEPIFATVDFVLGVHPANNRSYVSGVGVESPLTRVWI